MRYRLRSYSTPACAVIFILPWAIAPATPNAIIPAISAFADVHLTDSFASLASAQPGSHFRSKSGRTLSIESKETNGANSVSEYDNDTILSILQICFLFVCRSICQRCVLSQCYSSLSSIVLVDGIIINASASFLIT